GIRLQEARLSAGAAGAGPRAGRPGGERAPAEPDHVAGIAADLRGATDRGRHHGCSARAVHAAAREPSAALDAAPAVGGDTGLTGMPAEPRVAPTGVTAGGRRWSRVHRQPCDAPPAVDSADPVLYDLGIDVESMT